MAQGKYIRLRYLNSNDFEGLIFSDGFYQDLFLEGTLGEIKCETIEFGNKNENGEFSFTKKIKEYSVVLKVVGGEQLFELLNLISLCDNVLISNKVGEINSVIEMKVEADTNNISLISCRFILKRVVWTSCNNNPLAEMSNPISTQDVVKTISKSNIIYTTPLGVIGEYYGLLDNEAGSLTYGKFAIIKRVAAPINWEFIPANLSSRFKDLGSANPSFFYMKDIKDEIVGNFHPVTQLPTITEVINNGGGSITLKGVCLDGFILEAYESADNVTFASASGYVTSSVFNADGITFNATGPHFKLALIDYTYTICLYSDSKILP